MELNCKAGDLAITIKCDVPENLGRIVKVIAFEGFKEWPHFPDPIPVWLIKDYSDRKGLAYLYTDGSIRQSNAGLAPDCFLRPISGLGLESENEAVKTLDIPIKEKVEC
jgi:hypothetical protein